MKSSEIRQIFFDFFNAHHHTKIDSSSLIPAQDPTLLFTNAGMNQFKDLFLGNEFRSYNKAVTIQKCVRAGGKHNDLDNVGFTKRHLTFFEMMGNFSFGDYFKKEAIFFAWNLLTKGYKLKPENLYVSVYEEDQEAFDIWHQEMGIPRERIMRFGKKDNFWQMGDTGPCGPCTEIYVDQRPEEEQNTLPTYDDFEGGRLLEVWNLVFMQFDRQTDGTLVPLKQTGVDTGMGLERITSVLQNVPSVFNTDMFMYLIEGTEKLTGISYEKSPFQTKAAFHVLADHIRSSSLIIADGGTPSNEGRGYVLRKIIRRAALFAQKLTDKNIFPDLAKLFIENMSAIYPELKANEALIVSLLTREIEQFSQNLIKGQAILKNYFQECQATKIISGQQAFKLYDTYGFPLEVTILSCQEKGYTVDTAGFETYMEEQRALSGKKMKDATKEMALPETIKTTFVGYEVTKQESKVIGIIVNNELIEKVAAQTPCMIITEQCPFFAATGGQVDDTGTISKGHEHTPLLGLKKLHNNQAIGVMINAPFAIAVGDTVTQEVNFSVRRMTMNNHTATHLLQSALIEMLGKQVKQSGSVVTPDYLRFDFTYHQNLTSEEIAWVENRVNEKIQENIKVEIFETTYKTALEKGVIAIFGEKYNPEKVRVVDVPGFSAELCGGTHVPATGSIGVFKIIEVGALSAGNRRIVALTGPKAVALYQENFNSIKALSQHFKTKPEDVVTAMLKQEEQLKYAQQEVKGCKKELLKQHVSLWIEQIEMVGSLPLLTVIVEQYSADALKDSATLCAEKKAGVYCFISNNNEKSQFVLLVSPEFQNSVDLKACSTFLKEKLGLQGGGAKGMLTGGGKCISQDAQNTIRNYFKAQHS